MTKLHLLDFGSFHLGGRTVTLQGLPQKTVCYSDTWVEPVNPNGQYRTGSMYVQYMIPDPVRHLPLIFWPGGGLTGVNFETTPDGRAGWWTYFAQQGFPVYNTDPVERGRSGWSMFPEIYPQEPVFMTLQRAWESFRFALPGSYHSDPALRRALPGTRFPVQAFESFAQQIVPRWTCNQEASTQAYSQLLERTGQACVIAFSSGASQALALAQAHPELFAALVLIEPAGLPTIAAPHRLAGLPILALYGDFLDLHPEWPGIRSRIGDYLSGSAGANLGRVLDLPTLGLRGNSHFLMMDDNHLQIAKIIYDWLREHTQG
ncbi:TPA: esterase [Salmonella enterica]|uniref:Esterase n=1 Tax=Salmonella enterica TaxID=28901 RepID=A0A744CCW2_SALER|nr:esterase [Salmonella enterica]HAF4919997.1 esterase [Salmonella enterica]